MDDAGAMFAGMSSEDEDEEMDAPGDEVDDTAGGVAVGDGGEGGDEGGVRHMSLVTAAQVICILDLRYGAVDEGDHAHVAARKGVGSPSVEDLKGVVDSLMAKAKEGQLSDAVEWVRIRPPVSV